jgi:hypothetical protein
MTPQPQQEYICTEEQLTKLIHGIDDALECHYFMKKIYSRPHTQTPICDRCRTGTEPFCIGCDRLQPHDTAIRNAVLDVIIEFTKGNSETIEADDGTLEDAVFLGDLLAKLDSLRTQEKHNPNLWQCKSCNKFFCRDTLKGRKPQFCEACRPIIKIQNQYQKRADKRKRKIENCIICGNPLTGRTDKETCSEKCRKKKGRMKWNPSAPRSNQQDPVWVPQYERD